MKRNNRNGGLRINHRSKSKNIAELDWRHVSDVLDKSYIYSNTVNVQFYEVIDGCREFYFKFKKNDMTHWYIIQDKS